MAITNGYCDLDDLKAWLKLDDAIDDSVLETVIGAASRGIDEYCGRRFWMDSSATARDYYPPVGSLRVDDFVVASGETVKVDTSGDGTFGTTWTSGTNYLIQPVNRERNGTTPWPCEELSLLAGSSFPFSTTGRPAVRVTATWGWASVPDPVRQACLIKSARLFRRMQTPEGIAGGSEFGVIRISNKEDPDVCMLLAGFRRGGLAAGLVVG